MSIPQRRIVSPNDYRGYIPQRPVPSGAMVPPPLPPRRRATLGPAGSIYGSPFGGSYASPYGGDLFGSSYSMGYPYRSALASRYGGYGYGGYGAEDPYSPFQSVESIVRAISSLSMMVESTYQSMYMSFRAVLGVAENMDQLRRVVFDLFGSLTLVKTVIWFCKKVLYILGLLKNNPVREKAWEAAAAEVGAGGPAASRSGRTWPLVAFFGLMLGGPYVLYKLASPATECQWDPQTEGGIKCVAIHDFETDRKGELPFHRGEVLLRHNQVQGGWALASNKAGLIGYVPADRLKSMSQISAGAQKRKIPVRSNVPADGYLPVSAHGLYGPAGIPTMGADFDIDVNKYEDELQHVALQDVQPVAGPSLLPFSGAQVANPPPATSAANLTSLPAANHVVPPAVANHVVPPAASTSVTASSDATQGSSSILPAESSTTDRPE